MESEVRARGIASSFRTPSPSKEAGTDGSRRHSPWTAPRSRKRGKANCDGRLPDLQEAPVEGSPAEHCLDGQGRSAGEHPEQKLFPGSQRPEGGTALAGPGRSTSRTLALDHCQTEAAAGSSVAQLPRQAPVWQQQPEHGADGPPACCQPAPAAKPRLPERSSSMLTPVAAPSGPLERGVAQQQAALPKENLAPVSQGTAHAASRLGSFELPRTGSAATDSRRRAQQLESGTPAGLPGVQFVSDPASGKLSVQRTPTQRRQSSVASTPSPDVPAPGIRPDLHGRCPPSVPTSCRTIRRVLIDSPPHSGASSAAAARPASAPEPTAAPMSVERLLHEPKAPCLAPPPAAAQPAECEGEAPMDECAPEPPPLPPASGSPRFVLARGHVTPDNLLAGWDEEGRPGGPLKGPAGGLSFRRSGELSTFDERLQEAVQNGDVLTLGQAWQGTRRGTLKPQDIDTLNTLLKCFCKVRGDPGEAEEIVREACKQGRLKPNSSTYHHMAAIWTSHDQINN